MTTRLPVAKAPSPPDFRNVTEPLTFMPSRLNTVLVVASGATDAAAVICGRSPAFKPCVVETWVLIASDSAATEATRLTVWSESAAWNVAFPDSSTGTVVETRDDKDVIALLRAGVAPAIAVESEASAVCNVETCADHVDEFAEMFKLRVNVAVDRLVESAVSAFCSNDAAVEIAAFSDTVCDARKDVASLNAALADTSVDCICDTAVCSTVETDSSWLTRTGTVPEMALDSDTSADCSADTCTERADDSEDTSVLRRVDSDAMD